MSTHTHICACTHVFYTHIINMSIHMFVHMAVHMCIRMSRHMSVHLSVHISRHMSRHMSRHRLEHCCRRVRPRILLQWHTDTMGQTNHQSREMTFLLPPSPLPPCALAQRLFRASPSPECLHRFDFRFQVCGSKLLKIDRQAIGEGPGPSASSKGERGVFGFLQLAPVCVLLSS